MKIDLKFDDREFQKAMRDYIKASGKELSEAVNKKAVDVCFRAMRETDTASKVAPRIPARGSQLYHALASSGATKFGKAVRGQGNKELARKIYSSRRRAAGYSRAIWIKLAGDLGKILNSRFSIRHAKGTKARDGLRPVAKLDVDGLDSDHVRKVMQPALNKGLRGAAKDMRDYIERKMAARARKISGR